MQKTYYVFFFILLATRSHGVLFLDVLDADGHLLNTCIPDSAAVTLTCRTTALANSVKWEMNGTLLARCSNIADICIPSTLDRYSFASNISVEEFYFSVTNFTVTDVGTYRCQHGFLRVSYNAILCVPIISVVIKKNNIVVNRPNIPVLDGESMTWTCSPSPNSSIPTPIIQWFVGTTLMQSSTNTLFRWTATNDDHGETIFCKAYNTHSEDAVESLKPTLYVKVQVSNATLYQGTRQLNTGDILHVTQEKVTTLTCTTGPSRPAANIQWYIGSERQAATGSTFQFLPNDTYHNAEIYCAAYNLQPESKAVVSHRAVLFVKVPVSSVVLNYGTKQIVTGKPLTVTQGVSILLTCTAGFSRPLPTIYWFIGTEKQSTTGSSFRFVPDNTNHNFEIYCTAYNLETFPQGVVSQRPKLFVRVEAAVPVMLNGSKYNIALLNGERYDLQCQSTPTRPAAVLTWRVGSRTIITSTTFQIPERGGLVSVISTLSYVASRSDNGSNLICQSYIPNQSNISETRQMLIIVAVPDQPTDFKLLAVIESTALLFWRKGFNGGSEQIFILQLADEGQNNWINKTTVKEFDEHNLLFDKAYIANISVVESGSHIVRLVAANAIGNAESVLLSSAIVFSSTDSDITAEPCSSIGVAVGGAVIGSSGVTLLVTIAVVFLRKYKTERTQKKLSSNKKTDHLINRRETITLSTPKVEKTQEYVNLVLKNSASGSQIQGDSEHGSSRRSEPVAYEELGGSGEQPHLYKTLQQGIAVGAGDSGNEGMDSRARQDYIYESMHSL